MNKHQTGNEVKEEHIRVLGEELGLIYNRLYNEILLIHHKWSEFETLYGRDDETIELMTDIAPFFFWVVQYNLFNDVILSITRITDPIKSVGKNNLTIRLLPTLIDDEIKDKITLLIDSIVQESSFCRDRRNRIISHLDKDLAITRSANPLEIANRDKVNDLLKKFQYLINKIAGHYFKSQIYFGSTYSQGYNLLKYAQDGLKYDNLKWKYFENGKLDPSDFEENNKNEN